MAHFIKIRKGYFLDDISDGITVQFSQFSQFELKPHLVTEVSGRCREVAVMLCYFLGGTTF